MAPKGKAHRLCDDEGSLKFSCLCLRKLGSYFSHELVWCRYTQPRHTLSYSYNREINHTENNVLHFVVNCVMTDWVLQCFEKWCYLKERFVFFYLLYMFIFYFWPEFMCVFSFVLIYEHMVLELTEALKQ